MTIGERIRERRKELNISQDELAKKLKYKSRSSINKIELGHYNLTQSKIKAIADALETTPSYIMGWTDREPVTPPPAEEFTQAEKGLVYAYREAPEPTKRIVDVALEPYKPDNKVVAAVADEEKTVHYLNPYVGDYSHNNPEIPNFKTPKELKLFLNWLYKPEYVEDTYQYIKELFTLIQARAISPNNNYTEFIFSSIRRFILEDPDGFMRDFVYDKNPNETVLNASDSIYNWMFPQQKAYIYP